MKIIKAIFNLLLFALVLSGCSSTCDDEQTPPEDPCANSFEFWFDMDSTTGFLPSDIDTLHIIRTSLQDSTKTDTLMVETYGASGLKHYQLMPESPVIDVRLFCLSDRQFTLQTGRPFADDKDFTEFTYDLVLPGVQTFHISDLVFATERTGRKCDRVRVTKKECSLDGIHMDMLQTARHGLNQLKKK